MIFQGNQDADGQPGETALAAGQRKGKVQHSIIGSNLRITGDLHSVGDITVHGTVEGSITCRSLTLGEAPTISKVKAESVRVSGHFDGEIKAKEVILSSNARVTGDIWHESLAVDKGASIEGRLARLNSDKAKVKTKAKAEEKVTPIKAAEAAAG